MRDDRLKLYRDLEAQWKSKVILYVTSDRPGLEAQIHPDILPLFVNHLDAIGDVEKISLIIYRKLPAMPVRFEKAMPCPA